ncbi:MAG: serine--tRNA ligase [Desulfobacteraceae bacterium]|nr:serine--tRNA ligase [Desulfobacteraceae bacterium]
MLDIKYIVNNAEEMKENCKNRHVNCDIGALIDLYQEKNQLQNEVDGLRGRRNDLSSQIKTATTETRPALIEESKAIKSDLTEKETRLSEYVQKFNDQLARVPNRTHPASPLGKDDSENVEFRRFKSPTAFSVTPKDHIQIGKDLDLIDFESANKVSGSKFYYLKNEAVSLEFALIQHALTMLREEGFTLVSTPDLARDKILEGIGFNPRGKETQVYSIADSDLCLIGTAEITLGGMYSGTILAETELPLKLAGVSHCFRTEAGSYGQFSKGLYRVHQFTKVEMFAYTTPEASEAMHQSMLDMEERFFKSLDIPFRTVDICTGDLGGPAYRKYDLEAWMPGRPGEKKGETGNWGEITSTSNCTDYQARRLNIKYRPKKGGKAEFVHMLNGTAVAISRALIAILENYQKADGSVIVPKVLQDLVGMDVIKR